MDLQLRARCDRQIENEKALRNMSTLESELSIKVGALLYTAQDLPVSDDRVYAAKQILEAGEGDFSHFRGILQSLLILRMAASEDPESYLDTIAKTYKQLEEGTGISGLFAMISAVIIAEQHPDASIETTVDQVADLFGHVRKNHPERPNASELAYVALMYCSGKAQIGLEEEKEKIYAALKEQLQISDDTARAITLVLMTNSKSANIKADEFVAFYNRIDETGHATGRNQYMSVYAAFADLTYLEQLDIPEHETIVAIGEVEDYLKKKTGYGRFSISRDMRRVLAAALALQHYTIEIPQEKHSEFHPEISIELLLFIVLMSLVAIS